MEKEMINLFYLLQVIAIGIGRIAVIIGLVALCTLIVKRIWKGKTPKPTKKEEE